MTESPFMDSGLAILVFFLGDDPIACLNKAMAFLTAVASSRFPLTNNQLRTSSNPRNQATIQDDRVTVQQVQRRQGQSYSGEGHMARQCTQPKRPRNDAWFKDKSMLAKAQEAGKILDEEQLAFLADLGIPDDDEETLILEEESRSKISKKEKDPEAIKQNISNKPIDYEKLNRLSEDFGKHFTPQQELLTEQAF
ncbi:hypothetical protein Tco_1168979 [Tanacetum coccineum]